MRKPDAANLRGRLAANLRRLRHEADMTQEQLAEAADLDRRYITKLESASGGNATLRTLVKLANTLDVTPADLLAATRR